MPRLLLTALIVLVAAPLALLGWLSSSMLREERMEAERRLEAVLANRLVEMDRSLAAIFDGYARELRGKLSRAGDLAARLRRMQQTDPIVRRGLWVSRNGAVLFPPQPLSDDPDDLAFNAALHGLIDGRPRFATNGRPAGDARVPPTSVEPSPRAEWQSWYLDEGMQLVYWVPQVDGSVAGVLLERSRWMADLTAALPDSNHDEASTSGSGFTALADGAQQTVYRWGDEGDQSGTPIVSVPLSPPLSSWRLEYFSDEPLLPSVGWVPLATSLTGIGVVLAALGGYVLTGVQRQMRLAEQRVSFAGQVSHELRTPLTNIRLYAELAESDLSRVPAGEAAASITRRLKVIDTETRRLGRLVSGVLEVIRDDRKPRVPQPVAVVPDRIIDRTLEQFAPSFENAGLVVHRNAGASKPVAIDPDILELVLVNLLSNVSKYAAHGGRVDVDSDLAGGRLVVSVRDYGPGIPRRQRQRVFAPFARLDDSIRAPGGTGIGLTIARRSARRHRGDLTLESARGGCLFRLLLPALAPEAPHDDETTRQGRTAIS